MNLARLTVGVTGHRPNRLHVDEQVISRRIGRVLAAFRAGASNAGVPVARLVALSALAEGSDRLFASAALTLGYQLQIVLPFTSTDYETTFADPTDTGRYRELLGKAANVRELPGTISDTKAAYETVGRATVAASDILVAVWDGEDAAGRGGTPEIIDHALRQAKPVIWIDAIRDHLPRLIFRPSPPTPRIISLRKLAARSERVTRQKLTTLARAICQA